MPFMCVANVAYIIEGIVRKINSFTKIIKLFTLVSVVYKILVKSIILGIAFLINRIVLDTKFN